MKRKFSCILLILVLVGCLFIYYHMNRYKFSHENSFILPQPDYTLEVYYDSWRQFIPGMPGNSSDVPCIVKLRNNKTRKILYKEKFEMLQLLHPIVATSNKVEIGKFTIWEF